MQKVLDSKDVPNEKIDQFVNIALKHGMATLEILTPDKLLPHPQNRGKRMLVAAELHLKCANIVAAGPKMERIGKSIAFELPNEPVRSQYLAKIDHLVENAQGMLSSVNGTEVGLTVGSTHTAALCRVSLDQCITDHPKLANSMGKCHSPEAFPGDFKHMCYKGWEWVKFRRDVEEAFPALPGLLSTWLNNVHASGSKPQEIECLRSLGSYMDMGFSKTDAINTVMDSMPVCADYIQAVANYAQEFSGGKGAPLLVCLDQFSKLLKVANCSVGQEFMEQLASLKFQSKITSFPMTRLACLLAQCTSPKVLDGISKLITVTDLGKLRSSGVAELEAMEVLLQQAWDLAPARTATAENQFADSSVKAFGLFATRCIVHYLGKEKQSREPKAVYKSLSDVHSLFLTDLAALEGGATLPADSAASASSAATHGAVLSLADTCDTTMLALKAFKHLKIGGLFVHKDHGANVHKLLTVNDQEGEFEHTPIFGEKSKVITEYGNLKYWRPFNKELPKKLDTTEWVNKLPGNQEALQAEATKAFVSHALYEVVKANEMQDGFVLVTDPDSIYVDSESETFKKGEIWLPVFGTLQHVTAKTDFSKIAPWLIVKKAGKPVFTIALPSKDLSKDNSTCAMAAWVGKTHQQELANMELKYITEKGYDFPVLQNSKQVKPEQQLLIYESNKRGPESVLEPTSKSKAKKQ